MSLIATCPGCDTMFRVVADQLKLHNGKVRCGVCGHVFNAAECIAFVPDEAITTRQISAPAVSLAVTPPSLEIEPTAVPPAEGSFSQADQLVKDSVSTDEEKAKQALISEKALEPESPVTTLTEPSQPPLLAEAFLARESDKTDATRRMIRLAFYGSVLALLGFLLQASFWWRNELAVAVPLSRPWLEAGCQFLGCKLELPAHGEQLMLEMLQMTELQQKKLFQVRATVRNLSQLPQRAPHLELTLTSANGVPVIRRLLAPKEWLPTSTVAKGLSPLSDLPVEFTLAVELPFTGFTGRLLFAPSVVLDSQNISSVASAAISH